MRLCVSAHEIRCGRRAATAEPQAPGGPFSEKREREEERESCVCGFWLRHCVWGVCVSARECASRNSSTAQSTELERQSRSLAPPTSTTRKCCCFEFLTRRERERGVEMKKMRRGGKKRKEREVKKKKTSVPVRLHSAFPMRQSAAFNTRLQWDAHTHSWVFLLTWRIVRQHYLPLERKDLVFHYLSYDIYRSEMDHCRGSQWHFIIHLKKQQGNGKHFKMCINQIIKLNVLYNIFTKFMNFMGENTLKISWSQQECLHLHGCIWHALFIQSDLRCSFRPKHNKNLLHTSQ